MSHKKNAENNLPHQPKSATENSRRRALKSALLTGGIVAGSNVLPQKWARPVVDSVILPSHADTTDDSGNLAEGQPTAAPTVNYFFSSPLDTAQTDSLLKRTNSFAERALDIVVPTASAAPNATPVYVCLAITGNTFTGRVIREPYTNAFQDYNDLSGTVGVGLPLTNPSEPCSSTGITPPTMTVDQVTPTSCRCTFVDTNETIGVTVQQGACGQPDLTCRPT